MYKFLQANSYELKNAIYEFRYRVYVEEFGFEKKEDYPNNCEKDKYDDYSIHFVALNKNNKVIGTARLILDSEEGFPIEQVTKIKFKPSLNKIAEISRLAIDRNYRNQKEESVLFGLYKMLYQKSKEIRVAYWYMITEKKLFRLLRSHGFIFHQIGEQFQYHGTRVPYLGIILEIEQSLAKRNPELLRLLSGTVEN